MEEQGKQLEDFDRRIPYFLDVKSRRWREFFLPEFSADDPQYKSAGFTSVSVKIL